jgi:hypothetical protein
MLIVPDTNCVVSSDISPTGAPAEILRRWRARTLDVAVSEAILVEYERALHYDRVRLRHGLSAEELRTTIAEFKRFAILVNPEEGSPIIANDPDDDKFLWCADAAGASCVVSRDEHLLNIRAYKGIRILTPAAFLALIGAQHEDDLP